MFIVLQGNLPLAIGSLVSQQKASRALFNLGLLHYWCALMLRYTVLNSIPNDAIGVIAAGRSNL